jgi:hypothetical protein
LVEYSNQVPLPGLGEYTIVVAPLAESGERPGQVDPEASLVLRLVDDLVTGAKVDQSTAEAMVAGAFRVKPTRIKNILKKHRILVKQQSR